MTSFSEFNGIFIGELYHLPLFREKKCAFLTKKQPISVRITLFVIIFAVDKRKRQ